MYINRLKVEEVTNLQAPNSARFCKISLLESRQLLFRKSTTTKNTQYMHHIFLTSQCMETSLSTMLLKSVQVKLPQGDLKEKQHYIIPSLWCFDWTLLYSFHTLMHFVQSTVWGSYNIIIEDLTIYLGQPTLFLLRRVQTVYPLKLSSRKDLPVTTMYNW